MKRNYSWLLLTFSIVAFFGLFATGCDVIVAIEPTPACGDGFVDPGEQCDDGDSVNNDGCDNDCFFSVEIAFCGDGFLDPGEQCDDGDSVNNDGCDNDCFFSVSDILAGIELEITSSVDLIQTTDPRIVELPTVLVDNGETVIISEEVVVIVSIEEQLVIEELPDITLLGFENLTGFDIFLTYLANGVLQDVFVFDGETLLLEYPCLDSVDLLIEEDFDVFGQFVQSFDLVATFFNPEDFFCGEALILTFDPFDVSASIEIIDLVN